MERISEPKNLTPTADIHAVRPSLRPPAAGRGEVTNTDTLLVARGPVGVECHASAAPQSEGPTIGAPEALPRSETAKLDFKSQFSAKHDWCELIKDIVAMANSGGGRIWVGVSDDGVPTGADVAALVGVDVADVVNKIRGFTDVNFAAIVIRERQMEGCNIAEIEIGATPTPLVFGKPGNYADAQGKPQCAFRPGTLYVRHGPKSEPATTDDVRAIIAEKVEAQRTALLANLRQVIEAPADAVVSVALPSNAAAARGVRIVDSSVARDAVVLDINSMYPFRQKEVVAAINKHFDGAVRFTSADNLGVRTIHRIDQDRTFSYRPKFGSWQYSERYVEWLIGKIAAEPKFLDAMRQSFHEVITAKNREKSRRRFDQWSARRSGDSDWQNRG